MKKNILILPLLTTTFFCNAQNVGIGTTTPLSRLHISFGASGNITPFSPLVVEGNNNTYINLLTPNINEGGLLFGKADNAASGGIIYNNTGTPNGLQFRVNGNATAMVITNGGYVGIGNSDPAYQLDIANRIRIRSGGNAGVSAGLWLNNNANAEAAFIGMEDDTHVGFYGLTSGWKFGMNTQTGALKINGSEGVAGQVLVNNGAGVPEWQSSLPKSYYVALAATYNWAPYAGHEVALPGFSITVTLTKASSVNISALIYHSIVNCFGCGAQGRGFYLKQNGGTVYSVQTAEGPYLALPNFSEHLGAGTYTYQIVANRVFEDFTIKYYGSDYYGSYMTIMVIPD